MKTAILLLGHGSQVSEANSELIKIKNIVQESVDYEIVQAAFLQFCKPLLSEGLSSCIEQGANKIIVVPYFLYMGAHVQKDLPKELDKVRREYPDIEICLTKHIGADPIMAEIVCARIKESATKTA